MPIGNTPKHETNIAVEYGKSFSFGVWLRDKDDKHLDLQGVKLRFVARKQPRHRGTVVIETLAIPAHGANWMQHFEFQAEDLALPPGEYPYDITLIASEGYSTPLVKGFLIVGANADDYTENWYPPNSGMMTDITVQIRHRDVVRVTVERVDGLFKYVQQMIHDFRFYLNDSKDKIDHDLKKAEYWYNTIVDLINTKVFVIQEGTDHLLAMNGSLYFDLDDTNPGGPIGGGGQAIDEGTDHSQAKINALYFDTDDVGGPATGGGGMTQDQADARYALKSAVAAYLTQAAADTHYVNTAGDTMTGSLVLSGDPTLANQAATKQYVDQHTASPLEMYEIYPDAGHLPATTVGHPELKTGHFVITADDGHLHVATVQGSTVTWNNIGPATSVVNVVPDPSTRAYGDVLQLDVNKHIVWSPSLTELEQKVSAATSGVQPYDPTHHYAAGSLVIESGSLMVARTDVDPGQSPTATPGKWRNADLGHVALLAEHALTKTEADLLYLQVAQAFTQQMADNLYVPKTQVKVVETLPSATGLVDDTLIFLVPAVTP